MDASLCRKNRAEVQFTFYTETLKTVLAGQLNTQRHLDFVSELLDLVDGGVVLVGELPQLLLTALRHFLQVGALVLCVAQRALAEEKEKSINTRGGGAEHSWRGSPPALTSTSDSFRTTSIFSSRTRFRDSLAVVS